MKRFFLMIATVSMMTGAAAAQDICMSAAEMQSSLIDWYGEKPVAETSGDDTRLWVSDATGTWTLVKRTEDGRACVEATGENWTRDRTPQEMLATLVLTDNR